MPSISVDLVNDGYFSLDAGAIFGVVPKAIWGRYYRDEENTIRLAANAVYVHSDDISFLIDSGIGTHFDEKFARIYRIDKRNDLMEWMKRHGDPDSVTMIVNSHLHFDHVGHNNDFRNAYTYAQSAEFRELRYKNEITRSNYAVSYSDLKRKMPVNGSRKINNYVTVIHTGGHTPGHQVIIVNAGNRKIMYFGDIIPSVFHLKLPYRTAIDLDPLRTVEMKKKLVKKAIRDGYICIFNHDTETPAAILHGDYESPTYEKVDL